MRAEKLLSWARDFLKYAYVAFFICANLSKCSWVSILCSLVLLSTPTFGLRKKTRLLRSEVRVARNASRSVLSLLWTLCLLFMVPLSHSQADIEIVECQCPSGDYTDFGIWFSIIAIITAWYANVRIIVWSSILLLRASASQSGAIFLHVSCSVYDHVSTWFFDCLVKWLLLYRPFSRHC